MIARASFRVCFCWLACVVLLGLTALRVGAAPRELGRPFIQHFNGRDFNSDSQVFSPVQAADGLMYFANRTNAIIYDGRSWERVPITDGYVLRVTPASDGSMFVAPADDIGRAAKGPDGQWAFASFTARLPAELKPLGYVWTIVEHGGDLFFSTNRHLVRLTGGDPTKVRSWPATTAARLHLFHGQLYAFDAGVGLRRYTGDDFVSFADGPELRDPQLRVVFEAVDHGFWCVLPDGKIFRLDTAGRATAWPHDAAPVLGATAIRAAVALLDGGILLCTGDRGVVVLGPDGHVRYHLHEGNGLESNVVATAARDREGGVWITHAAGASRLELDPRVTVFDRNTGFGRNTTIVKMLRHRGTVYGVAEDGFFRLEPAPVAPGGEARWVRTPTPGRNVVRSLASLDDTLFVLRLNSLARWTGTALEDLQPLPASRGTEFEPTRQRLLVGTEAGLAIFDPAGDTWNYTANVPLITSPVESLVPGDGYYWIGTLTQGIFRVTFPVGAPALAQPIGPAEGLPAGQRILIEPTAAGRMFYTAKEIFFHDPATGRFVPNDRLLVDGRPLRQIERFSGADDGRIFTQVRPPDDPTRSRLGWFTPDRNGPTWSWHPLPARLTERLGTTGAKWLFHDNHEDSDVLWASGNGAVLRIDLKAPETPAAKPGVVIRRADRGEIPLPESTAPRLPFSRQPVRFTFASPSFSNTGAIKFQTRLLGYDDGWSEPSPRNEIEFTNLVGGPFTFEVRAIDPDHRVGEPARFVFAIAPPWYRHDLAVVLYVLALVGSVFGFVRWRLHRSERERARLEKIVADRTTELAVATAKAESANLAKSAFLANMSHELRTPLNGVIGYAQVLMKDRDLSRKNRERLQVVQTSGEHLLRMINEVLDFSKIEAGRMELRPAPFHFPQLLRDIAAALSPRAEQKELEFIFDAAADLPELVIGDALKLRQILDNLLSNAVKFTTHGNVTLKVISKASGSGPAPALDSVSGSQLSTLNSELFQFTISDSGVGIADSDLPSLFQPFHQVADGRPPEPGTGLGLAISHRFVALMDGKLEVSSQLGVGTRFSFTLRLPVLALRADSPGATPLAITGYVGDRRHIMIVDDVAINRHVLRELLAPLGFALTEAGDGATALALAAATPPDLVFLDLRMPGMDGFELAQRLRALPDGARIKLIAMSASVLSFNRDDAFAAGCDDFLPKPFREEDLLARIRLALRLDWASTPDPTAPTRNSPPPFPDAPTHLSSTDLAELLALARRGEIVALRRKLADLRSAPGPADPLVDALESLAKSFRMERIRELLERAEPRPLSPP